MPDASTPVLSPDDHRPFGAVRSAVSPLGFGGAPIGVLETEHAEAGRVLGGLLDAGVNLIDTAAMYRGSEAMIGRTIADRRDAFTLVSKCGHAIDEVDAPAWSPELIRASVERSLQRLHTDVIDVMLLHSCEQDVLEAGDALGALVELRDAGAIRHVGYSGDGAALTWAASQPDIDVIQTSVSLCDQANIGEGLAVAASHGLGVMAKRPIANAPWKGAGQYEQYANYAAPYAERFVAMGLAEPGALAELGADEAGLDPNDPDRTWPALALRFTLSVPGVSVAIVGTTRHDHVHANLAAAAAGPLPASVFDRMVGRFTAAVSDGAAWPGLR
ncbi:MAG: aldo/keto reductase [Phycisphaerales bacterium]